MRYLALFLVLGMFGCAAVVKPVTTPNGSAGFYVSCDGSADDWSSCYQAAANACNGKYAFVDRNETSTATAYGPIVRRSMVIECKK